MYFLKDIKVGVVIYSESLSLPVGPQFTDLGRMKNLLLWQGFGLRSLGASLGSSLALCI